MVTTIKGAIAKAVRSDRLWGVMSNTLVKFARHAESQRRLVEWDRERQAWTASSTSASPSEKPAREYPGYMAAFNAAFPKMVVQHGPFKGMRYPETKSVGSALFPKLLGSYERELHPLLDRIIARGYSDVVDIGCAEGYYANGLALRLPQARIHAFDTNKEAIRLCQEMAILNGVADRLSIGEFCSAETLAGMKFGGRALILADCESYEKNLFTDASVAALRGHDVLIEVHDFIDLEISPLLRRRFAKTHRLEVVESIDDIQKAHRYDYPQLHGYDVAARRELVGEFRPSIMEWFYFSPLEA